MSGLFSRLVQQAMNQRHSLVEPARVPGFPGEFSAASEPIDAPHQDSAQVSAAPEVSPILAQPRPPRAEDTNTEARQDSVALANSPPLFATPRVTPMLTRRKDHTVKINLSEPSQNQEVVAGKETQEAPTIQPQFQPQLPTAIEQAIPQDPIMKRVKQKELQVPIQNPMSIQPQAFAIPINQRMFPMDRDHDNKNPVSDKSQHLSDSQPTTINVSIGQIDIKATSSEIPTPKKTRQSNRQPCVSLDDYQLKRQQGER